MNALQVTVTLAIGLLALGVIASSVRKGWRMARAVRNWERCQQDIDSR